MDRREKEAAMAVKKDPREARALALLEKGIDREKVAHQLALSVTQLWPAGMERFFEGHAKLPPGPVDPEAYRAIAHSA